MPTIFHFTTAKSTIYIVFANGYETRRLAIPVYFPHPNFVYNAFEIKRRYTGKLQFFELKETSSLFPKSLNCSRRRHYLEMLHFYWHLTTNYLILSDLKHFAKIPIFLKKNIYFGRKREFDQIVVFETHSSVHLL